MPAARALPDSDDSLEPCRRPSGGGAGRRQERSGHGQQLVHVEAVGVDPQVGVHPGFERHGSGGAYRRRSGFGRQLANEQAGPDQRRLGRDGQLAAEAGHYHVVEHDRADGHDAEAVRLSRRGYFCCSGGGTGRSPARASARSSEWQPHPKRQFQPAVANADFRVLDAARQESQRGCGQVHLLKAHARRAADTDLTQGDGNARPEADARGSDRDRLAQPGTGLSFDRAANAVAREPPVQQRHRRD